MYFQLAHQNCIYQAPYCFMGSSQTGIEGALLFIWGIRTMVVDTNQLWEALCDFLQAWDGDWALSVTGN